MDTNIKELEKYLPSKMFESLQKYYLINEIRLHKDKAMVIVSDNRNIITDIYCSAKDFNIIVDNLCNHSLHSHVDTIKNGYISAGIYRVGVCGKYTGENISEITALNIRIPHMILNISEPVINLVQQENYTSGVLIYSPPSGGKTTLLRDLTIKLSTYKRVTIIDSRNELYDYNTMNSPLIDIFNGYPKATAIELATRTMSPEYIICDEIGSYNECEMILSVQNTGVPLIASAHALNINNLLQRKNIRLLHDNMIFKYYIGLKRQGNKFDFTITKWEDINKCIS